METCTWVKGQIHVVISGGVKAFFHLLPLMCDSDVVDDILDIMYENVNE